MKANLHLHSRFSDGTVWPAEQARRAAAAGLELVALTDHDSLEGVEEFAGECRRLGLLSVAGAEFDCVEASLDYKSELLCYYPAGPGPRSLALLERSARERRAVAEEAALAAADLFRRPSLCFGRISDRKREGRPELDIGRFSLNKVDVWAYLRDEGALPADADYRSFKRAYFDTGLLSRTSRAKPLCAEVADAALSDGGFVVIPHLGHEFDDDAQLMAAQLTRLRETLRWFRSIGVGGVELYHYRNGQREALNDLVRKEAGAQGFFFTYGSDCHGPGSGKDTIADFSGPFDGFPGYAYEKPAVRKGKKK